jgi:hypothetical protein
VDNGKTESLISELAEVLVALKTSQELLLGRLQRIRLEGLTAVPSAAGFIAPLQQPEAAPVPAQPIIEVERTFNSQDAPTVAEAPAVPSVEPMARRESEGRDYDYFAELDAKLARLWSSSPDLDGSN